MFITFEGIEGSGKTTQIRRVSEFLRGAGHSLISTREPGSTDIGAKIRAILLDPANKSLDHRAELLLYMADRAHHIGTVVRPALSDGQLVLCDRYFDATLAYQGYARGLDIGLLRDLHRLVLDDFMPHLTLLLDLPAETGLSRAWKQIASGAREDAETRFEKEKLAFHERVRAGYLDLARQAPERFRIIDALQKEDQVRAEIVQIISERLKRCQEQN
ncbi:thymidylate kinase [Desulfonema ishimotonii]|uniref:Thymidylate kinase n=1 Tax=Desulfonema ishimotonii TaxID=45657 RepID=A0A401FQU3_9BACT|nr:dTMP kinase [Desulfonema ishimotonii]GBC59331.1 thymidylate kinase [Desulfonema ishimotonii]